MVTLKQDYNSKIILGDFDRGDFDRGILTRGFGMGYFDWGGGF